MANNTKDNRAGEKPYRLSKTGPSPGPSSRPPPIRAARPGFGAIVLLKQAPEPQGRDAAALTLPVEEANQIAKTSHNPLTPDRDICTSEPTYVSLLLNHGI